MRTKILAVEDCKNLCEVFQIYFDMVPEIEFDHIDTIKGAFEKLITFKPDIILLDFLLKDGMGVELFSKVCDLENKPVIIVMSALNKSKDLALEHKADYFLSKPFSFDTIEQILADINSKRVLTNMH